MPRYFRRGACSLAVVLFFSGLARAQVLASSARQLEPGSWTLIPYYQGTYRQLSHDRWGAPVPFEQSLEDGHATFWLDGTKLHGEFALTRFKGGGESDAPGEEIWLLIKEIGRASCRERVYVLV